MKIESLPGEGSYVEDQEFYVNADEAVVSNVEFRRCVFRNCRLKAARFDRCYFDDCLFEACEMALSRLSGTSFLKCKMVDSSLDGIAWHSAGLTLDINFIGSRLRYSNFFGMRLKKIRFVSCNLEEVTFSEANLEAAEFPKCNLQGAIFSKTNLAKASFVSAENYSIDILGNNCKGAKFSLPEAANLLLPFGIKIE